jgi:fluoroacetyl-CoA thioesterase
VKPTLTAGLVFSKSIVIDEERCISFMGRENMVYATPRMVSDVEYACRDYLLAHRDAGEDSVALTSPSIISARRHRAWR